MNKISSALKSLPSKKKRSQSPKTALALVFLESVIAHGSMSMPIMSLFYIQEIGLDFGEIALTQSIFTAVIVFMNAPLGLAADCLGRKWVNIIGDLGIGIGHLFYAFAHNIYGVIACEVALGVFRSMSYGVDIALLHHFSAKASSDEKELATRFLRLNATREVVMCAADALMMILGGVVGAIDFRLAVALSGVPYLIGAVIQCFLRDDSKRMSSGLGAQLAHRIEKIKRHHAERGVLAKLKLAYALFVAFFDLIRLSFMRTWRIMRESFGDVKLKGRILASSVGSEIGHGLIWLLTPMLCMLGLPDKYLGFAWVAVSASNMLGASLAKRYSVKMSPRKVFSFAAIASLLALVVLSVKISPYTIGFYFVISIMLGWFKSSLPPLVQQAASEERQATVASIASTVGKTINVFVGWIVGKFADISYESAMLVNLVIFVILVSYAMRAMTKGEQDTKNITPASQTYP